MSRNEFLQNSDADLHLEEMLMVLNAITANKELPESERITEFGAWFSADGLLFARILPRQEGMSGNLVVSLDAFGKVSVEVEGW